MACEKLKTFSQQSLKKKIILNEYILTNINLGKHYGDISSGICNEFNSAKTVCSVMCILTAYINSNGQTTK